MFDDATFAQRQSATAADGDRELFALIAEWQQVTEHCCNLFADAEQRENEIRAHLPAERVEIGRVIFKDGSEVPVEAAEEGQINEHFGFMQAWRIALDRSGRPQDYVPRPVGRDELIAELRARKAAIEDAKRSAGCNALNEEAACYRATGWEIWERIMEIRPATVRGALAMIEFIVDGNEVMDMDGFENALAGLRAIAKREAC